MNDPVACDPQVLFERIVQDVSVAKTYRLGFVHRSVNVMMAAMIRHGLGGKSSYLLTTAGRHSGEKQTTPVMITDAGGARWLVSPYGMVGWVYNVRAKHEITLRRGKRVETTFVEEASRHPVFRIGGSPPQDRTELRPSAR